MKTKSMLSLIVGGITFLIVYTIYSANWSQNARKGGTNISNSKKIEIGMDKIQVYNIMGEPDTMIDNRVCYITNLDSYPYIEFSFNQEGKVLKIYSPIE